MISAVQARVAAQLTVEQAARKARISPSYLRHIEKYGGASYVLAVRLSRLYHCSIHLFLYSSHQGQSGRPSLPRGRNRSAANRKNKRNGRGAKASAE